MRNPILKKLGLRQPTTLAELRNHPLTAELYPDGGLCTPSGNGWCLVVVKGYYMDNQLHACYDDAKGCLSSFSGIRECSDGRCESTHEEDEEE